MNLEGESESTSTRGTSRSDSAGRRERADTSEVADLKERRREIRSKIAKRTHNDNRIRHRLLSKYGRREGDRMIQQIHRLTKKIVEHAKENHFGIVMERLKGIRKLYRKGTAKNRGIAAGSTPGHFLRFRGKSNTKPTGTAFRWPTLIRRERPQNVPIVAPQ